MGRFLPVVVQKNPMIFELCETQTQTLTEIFGPLALASEEQTMRVDALGVRASRIIGT